MSLKVINIDSINQFLTVDNNVISVDSIEISVDATTLEQQEHTIKVSYRYYLPEIKLVLWDELNEVKTVLPITVVAEPGLMVITFSHLFKDGDSYEVKVLNPTNDDLVWRGKIFATVQTDLENYKLHKVVNNNIIKI